MLLDCEALLCKECLQQTEMSNFWLYPLLSIDSNWAILKLASNIQEQNCFFKFFCIEVGKLIEAQTARELSFCLNFITCIFVGFWKETPPGDVLANVGLITVCKKRKTLLILNITFQVRTICRDFGVVCIRREGKDIEKIISSNKILKENMVSSYSKFPHWLC